MNIEQFSKLQVGDKVRALSGSVGEVTNVGLVGVHVRWGGAGPAFFVAGRSSLWMHWEKVRTCPNCGSVCQSPERCTDEQCLGGDYDKIADAMTGSKDETNAS